MPKSKRVEVDETLDRELRYLAMAIAAALPETLSSAERALKYAGFAYRTFIHAGNRRALKAWASKGRKRQRRPRRR